MPRVRIEWLSTRTAEQRKALVERITEAFVDIVDLQPDQISIVFEEIPPELSAKGGIFWSERLKEKL
ncbi:MAG: tautomerase family protein [Deltaproteobacteria bacterium]|nr:tautomerase family protein [Deltaproteobacteria bacterium]